MVKAGLHKVNMYLGEVDQVIRKKKEMKELPPVSPCIGPMWTVDG